MEIAAKSWLLLIQGNNHSFFLNNAGDIIILKYQDQIIDQVAYGNFDDGNISDNTLTAEKGNSVARKNEQVNTNNNSNDFLPTSTPTQNQANIITEIEKQISDLVPPQITLISKPDNLANKNNALFEFAADEAVNFYCFLNDGEWQVCETPMNYENLFDGENIFNLKAIDLANNQAEINYSWLIDSISPFSEITMAGDYFNAESWPIITGIISSFDNIDCIEIQIQKGNNSFYLDDDFIWQENQPEIWMKKGIKIDLENKIWSYNLPTELLDEDNNYFIRSRLKNKFGKFQKKVSEKGFIFDNTPPGQLADIEVRENEDSSDLEIFWEEINDNFSGISHYEILENDNRHQADASHYFFKGKNRKKYYFKVRACDRAGNCGGFSKIKEHQIKLNSLIINEIQISGDREFIELHNPTQQAIYLKDYYLAYYSSEKEWTDSPRLLKKFPNNAVIPAQGYYLVAVYNFPESRVDWLIKTGGDKPYSSGQLSDQAGSIAIFPFNPQGQTEEDLKSGYLDVVGWGENILVKENEAVLLFEKNYSLERKFLFQDTDNNFEDFFLQENPNPQSAFGFWLDGWSKRKLLAVDNKDNANNLENYQIKINLDYQPEMNFDFSDIRFTASDGKNIFSYFLEEYQDSTSAVFWIKIPEIPAYSEIIIYQYYGNESAVDEGNGKQVFEFFDDFSEMRLADYDYQKAIWQPSDSFVKIGNGFLSPKNFEIKDFYLKTKMLLERQGSQRSFQGLVDYRYQDQDNYWRFGLDQKLSYDYAGLNFVRKSQKSFYLANFYKDYIWNEWADYEIKVYEAYHQVGMKTNNWQKNWQISDSELNQSGKIYLTNEDANVGYSTRIDYLLVAKNTQPEPKIIFNKEEGYQALNGQARNSFSHFLGWGKQKEIIITNNSSTTSTSPLIDFPIKIELNYLPNMEPDFSDIRFADSNQTNINYWNESYLDSTSAVFWVKVPEIPTQEEKTIYLYYDNPSATYQGKGEDVFSWFDDFKKDKRLEYDYSKVVFDTYQGILRMNANGFLSPIGINSGDFYLKTKMLLEKEGVNSAPQVFVDYRCQDQDNHWRFGLNQRNSYDYRGLNFEKMVGSLGSLLRYYKYDFWNEWDVYEIWAFDKYHQTNFTDQSGQKWTWDFEDEDNKTGNIFLKTGPETSAGKSVLVDYFYISKYQPGIAVFLKD